MNEIKKYAYIASFIQSSNLAKKLGTAGSLKLPDDWYSNELEGEDHRKMASECAEVLEGDSTVVLVKDALKGKQALEIRVPKLQHVLVEHLGSKNIQLLKNSVKLIQDKIRLDSISMPSAAAWLSALPGGKGLFMGNDVFIVRLCRWFGAPFPVDVGRYCVNGCDEDLRQDPAKHHMEYCSKRSTRIWVHDAMVAEMQIMNKSSGMACQKEVFARKVLFLPEVQSDSSRQRFDLYCSGPPEKRPWVGDVTIVHPFAPSIVSNTAAVDDVYFALDRAQKEKEGKYLKACEENDTKLEVYAMSQYGACSLDYFHAISRAAEFSVLGNADLCSKTAFKKRWITRLSVTLQRSLGAKELSLAQEIDWAKYGSGSSHIRPKEWYSRNRNGNAPIEDGELDSITYGPLMDLQ